MSEFKGTKNLLSDGLHIREVGKTGRVGQAFLMSFEHDRSGKSLPDTIGEANAKLWAASPDLLEALQAAKTELEMYIPITDVKVLDKIDAALRKAISK